MRVVKSGIATESEIRRHWDIGRFCDWYDMLLLEREAGLQMDELRERMRSEADGG